MDLRTYWQSLSPAQKADFAARCETTAPMLSQVAGGHRRAGESLAINIDRESNGVVPVESLRGDVDWAYLRGTQAAPDSVAEVANG